MADRTDAFRVSPWGGWRAAACVLASGASAAVPDAARLSAARRHLVAIAAGQIPTAVVGNLVVAFCAAGILAADVPPAILAGWLALMLATTLARLSLPAGAAALAPESGASAMARHVTWMTGLAGANGLLWGVFGGILGTYGDIELRAFASCVVVAMVAAAVASNVAQPAAGRAFVTAALLPAAASWLVPPLTRNHAALAVLGLFYLGVLLTFLRGTAGALSGAVLARLHNEQLTAEVETVCAQLAAAVQAAEEANRSKSRFLANMSHEIRTPMNAVLGLATTLLDEDLTPGHRESIAAIRESADVLLHLINEILDFSQIEVGRVTLEDAPFSPARLLRDTVGLIGPRAAAKGLALEVHGADALPAGLRGDAGRVRQVLLNLVGNAVKFTERGHIFLVARRAGPEDAAVAPEDNAFATIEWQVHDSGIGIAPEALKTLFRDFAQADDSIARRFGGSGLGLAISRRLIEMMGGTITARSELGVGSVFGFRLTLPVAKAPAAEASGDATAEDLRAVLARRGSRARVLLAEDNPINQLVAKRLLMGFALDVDVANDGREAVAAADRIAYDLIYMDMRMPEMDGLEATREIRRRAGAGNRVPIVAFTANAFEEDIRACHAAGMDDFLTKPVRKAAFLGATLKALMRPVPAADAMGTETAAR